MPISLYNALYKIISKLIEIWVKKTLSTYISPKQFRFLDGRQIQGVIGIAQECMHSIKIRNTQASLIKVDLTKAYNCIDWDFLRMVLYKEGISSSNIGWIMGCIQSTNFTIIINGYPTRFFRAFQGLQQGCDLSLLLFILVMDSSSQKMREEKKVVVSSE